MTQVIATLTTLPKIGESSEVYVSIILNNNSLNQGIITSLVVRYGNVKLIGNNLFIPQDSEPIALIVNSTFSAVNYTTILYTNAINQQIIPNNFTRLVQKIPLGIFADINSKSIIGQICAAKGLSIDDYYAEYFNVQNQVYSDVYSPQLEYEYNGTVGLLSTSVYPDDLFHLLSSANIVALNSYDLELFVSKYIYYRLGTISAVFIFDAQLDPANYWVLGRNGLTELNVSTILGPGGFILTSLNWTIYNSSAFTDQFKQELYNLIIKFSRADIGNVVNFDILTHPNDGPDFTLIGPTYQFDPRILYGKCIEYIGPNAYPLNIIGYLNIIYPIQDVGLELYSGGNLLLYTGGELLLY